MTAQFLQPIWTPADFHETVQSIRALALDLPREVGESALLSELVDQELR